uniref:VWFA domain-containing protein n=1 Tax=Borely moumouvirus TaxID=2712067 RepID=A0A6G6AC01_9VIRU
MNEVKLNTFVQLPIIDHTILSDANVCFCIDSSGSTGNKFAGKVKYLDIIKIFIDRITKRLNKKPKLISWDCSAVPIDNLEQLESKGGTCPSCLFENQKTYNIIKNSDVVFIITDGKIDTYEVNNFAKCINEQASHLKAVIGVIVGRRTSTEIMVKPHEIDVSVLLPAMISNACILFYNYKKIYTMWTSGIFKNNFDKVEINLETTWDEVPAIDPDLICKINIPIPNQEEHHKLVSNGYIPLGIDLYFNRKYLLLSHPTYEEIMTYPFYQICQHFKINNKYQKLYNWFMNIYNSFIKKIYDTESSNINMEYGLQNKESFIASRNKILCCKYPYIPTIVDHVSDQEFLKVLNFFVNMLNIIKEDNNVQYNDDGYTLYYASISRYTSNKVRYDDFNDDLDEENNENKYFKFPFIFDELDFSTEKYPCDICGSEETPFIILQDKIYKNNIGKLLKEDIINPHIFCSKCSECLKIISNKYSKKSIIPIPIIPVNDSIKIQYFRWLQYILFKDKSEQINQDLCETILAVLIPTLKKIFIDNNFGSFVENFENSLKKN